MCHSIGRWDAVFRARSYLGGCRGVTPSRSYEGPAVDATGQHISEAPYWQDGETVDVVDDRLDGGGETRVEDVPLPDGRERRPDTTGQTTLGDYVGGSR